MFNVVYVSVKQLLKTKTISETENWKTTLKTKQLKFRNHENN